MRTMNTFKCYLPDGTFCLCSVIQVTLGAGWHKDKTKQYMGNRITDPSTDQFGQH